MCSMADNDQMLDRIFKLSAGGSASNRRMHLWLQACQQDSSARPAHGAPCDPTHAAGTHGRPWRWQRLDGSLSIEQRLSHTYADYANGQAMYTVLDKLLRAAQPCKMSPQDA